MATAPTAAPIKAQTAIPGNPPKIRRTDTNIGNPRSFHKEFKFIVEIDDIGHAGFQKCSELSVEVANVQYFEGGSLTPNKSPGRLTFADVTLRGAI